MIKHTSNDLSAVLDKLATDDDFRQQMLGDPVNALDQLGIALHPDQVPETRSLPSKESIAADQSALQSKLESTDGMVIFLLSGGA